MARRIYLKLGPRVRLNSSTEALPTTLTIYDDMGRVEEMNSYLSPMPKALREALQKWQIYVSPNPQSPLTRRVRFEAISPRPTTEQEQGNINFEQLANDFKYLLNQWLNQEGWLNEDGNQDLKIRSALERYYRETEQDTKETQIFIQTEDRTLRGLPWQEWETLRAYCFSHRHTEVSISATDFRRPEQQQTPLLEARIRVLAIFGDESLDLSEERQLIASLGKFGGTIHVLSQPDRHTLEQVLQDRKGWHILFFAGHSGSDDNGRIGWIEIRPTERILIADLTSLLTTAIQDKLQVAIFNSCDGLGLANHLTSLSLPYCIVMRESVESLFARRLLQHLLTAFVNGKSLFASMHTARELLRQEFDEQGRHPGKSWLPVIVANPEARPLTWDGMFTERRVNRMWEVLFSSIALIAIAGLPLCIWIEFQSSETLQFYAQLYPHLVVYSSLFLWISIYALYRLIGLTRQKADIFWGLTLAVFFLSFISLALELQTNYLMLFEVQPNSSVVVPYKKLEKVLQEQAASREDIQSVMPQSIDSRGNLVLKKQAIEAKAIQLKLQKGQNSNRKAHNSFLRVALTYEVWRSSWNQFSVSRWFYALSYFTIFFCASEIFALVFSTLFYPNSVFRKNRYFSYLLLYELGLLLWVPFYFYYIKRVKDFLFTPPFTAGLANLTPPFYIFTFSLLVLTMIVIVNQTKASQYRIGFLLTIIACIAFAILMSIFGVPLIDQTFGITSRSTFITWIGSITFSLFLFIPITRLIDAKVRED